MIYNFSKDLEYQKAILRIEQLKEKGSKVDITEKRRNRTTDQNSYLHLILSFYGLEVGYTLQEIKDILKRDICPDIFEYDKGGHKFYRSTANLNTLEMAKVIHQLKHHAAVHGCPLPDAENQEHIDYCRNQLENYENYKRI
tara:strand:+ start:861 stop:1283 length:423 start_codon:yes stop_codon:yes gene_type:complete